MAPKKTVAAREAADPNVVDKPRAAGKAVGYSRQDAILPEVSCADTSMGGYQDVSGREDRVRTMAYRLWDEADRPGGRDAEFWSQAERQVDGGR